MKSLFYAAILACACIGVAHAQTPPPVEAYGRLPAISDAAISPNGERLVISGFDGERSFMRIINIETGAVEHASGAPEGTKLRGVGWADDDHALFYVSGAINPRSVAPVYVRFRSRTAVLEYSRVGVHTLSNGRQEYITLDEDMSWAHVGLTSLTSPIEGDPGTGRMISWGQSDGRLGVYRVRFDTMRARAVSFGTVNTVDIILDSQGGIGARVDVNEDTNHWRIFDYGSGSPRQIMEGESEYGDAPGVAGYLHDGRLAYVYRPAGEERFSLIAIDPATAATTVLAQHDRFDVRGAIADPWTHRIVGASWTEDLPQQRFFDPATQSVYERLRGHFAEAYAVITSWSRDRRRYLVWAETNSDAGAYYVYEPAEDRLRLVARAYPELTTPAALGARQAIAYPARDRVRIPAYLTLPAGVEARGLPLVVLVHGGPHSRDNFSFDWWASFLASRGYAVLQPNYRGSTGYGHAWFDAGRGGWGDGVMQTDVEDGVTALVRAGIADGRRVCIMGGSYGGYAALAGATLTPELYSCAVSVNGVSDVLQMLADTENITGRRSFSSDWWRLSIGDRRNERERLVRISPVNGAANVRAPILLLHGADDTVVPVYQSREMARRLREAGREHRYVEMQGDDHWLSNAATRTQMLREIESFLAENLRPAPGAE